MVCSIVMVYSGEHQPGLMLPDTRGNYSVIEIMLLVFYVCFRHLVALADRLFEGKDNKTVYFPCCGNSADMKWYVHVSIECSPTAKKQLSSHTVAYK